MGVEFVEYEVLLSDGRFFPDGPPDPSISLADINRQFGFTVPKIGKTTDEVWNDSHNDAIRALRGASTALKPGDHVFLLHPTLDADAGERLETYEVQDDPDERSGFHVITDRINARFPPGGVEVLSDGALSPVRLYFAFENSSATSLTLPPETPFRRLHEPFRIPPKNDVRFSQLVAHSLLVFRVKKRIVIRTPVKPKPTPVNPPIPIPEPPANTIVVPVPIVHIAIHQGADTLRPLDLAANRFRATTVTFDVTLDQPATKLVIDVVDDSGATLFSEAFSSGPMLTVGTHQWSWDGFTSGGVLDTEVLRGRLAVGATMTRASDGGFEVAQLNMIGRPSRAEYADLRIDLTAQRIDAKLFARFVQLADDDATLGAAAGGIAAAAGLAGSLALAALKARIRLSTQDLSDATSLALGGITKYWTRNGSDSIRTGITPRVTIGADTFVFIAQGLERDLRAVQLDLMKPLVTKQRACNLGAPIRGLPVILPYDPAVAFNSGAEHVETSAHEYGHSILRDEGGVEFSVTHKGSSTKAQEPIPGHPYPTGANEEIDLMQYFSDDRPSDWESREVAAEDDVKGLISNTWTTFAAR